MAVHSLEKSPCGYLVSISDSDRAFVPAPLPKSLALDSELIYRLDEASRAVATLVGVGETMPNPHLLIRPFVRREAVLSSRIEGTQASLSDLFMYEAAGKGKGDVHEVVNYIRALEHGLELLKELPVCLRLVNEVHGVLLQGVRGQEKRPGELRNEIVWIGSQGTTLGQARFIPPPPAMVRDLMEDWERFANEDLVMPPLVQCALLHYQFEAIHPYLDGNGRIGRLLITLFLYAKRILPQPLLYLSAFFERDRSQYYDRLFNVSAGGDWKGWLNYFLVGVVEQAHDALRRTRRIRALQEHYRRLLQVHQRSVNTLRLVDELFAQPYMTAPLAAHVLGVTAEGARGVLGRLAKAKIVEELAGTWPRIYVARELLDIIEMPKAPETPA